MRYSFSTESLKIMQSETSGRKLPGSTTDSRRMPIPPGGP